MEIKIKKKNRGKFTKAAKAAGESVQEHAHSVLNNPKATKLQKKRAQFAINAKKWHHKDGGLLMQQGGNFTTRALVSSLNDTSKHVKYGKGNYNNVDTKLLSQLKPNKKGHYDDVVKLVNHPTHPSRGTFNKDGTIFYMSDFGMQNPNLTLFGMADGNQDGQATMVYKGGIVLPEVTVTKNNGNYIDNPYDQLKLYRYQQGGQILQRYTSLINAGISPQVAFDTSHLSLIEDGRKNKYYSFGKRATNLKDWTTNVVDSLTTGRYKNLRDITTYQQFKQGLKDKKYNPRPAFYNIEMGRGRNKNKQIVNQYNQAHGLPLVAGLYNSNGNLA